MVETTPICGHYYLVYKNFHEQVKGAAKAAPLLFSVLLVSGDKNLISLIAA
jgi:hypothetical protein